MTDREVLLDALRDGEWHIWRELARLAERNLGREMVLAAEMTRLVKSGLAVSGPGYRYRLVLDDFEKDPGEADTSRGHDHESEVS